MEGPDPRLCSRPWRIRHSLWLLAPILGFGYFSLVGIPYAAIRMRGHRHVLVNAGVSLVMAIGVFVLSATTEDADGQPSAPAALVLLLWWVLSIGSAVLVNRTNYLPWRSRRGPGSPRPAHVAAPYPTYGAQGAASTSGWSKASPGAVE